MKEISLLSKGFFASKSLDTKVKTRAVSKKEKILGHLIGPLGLIFVINSVSALVEKFFMQQTAILYPGENNPLAVSMGDTYGLIMTITKIAAVFIGILNSWLISHTKSRQGRFRPWYLIFGFVSIIVCALIFLFPGTTLGDSYWFYFFTLLICYHTVGSTYFYLFKDNIVSVSTRDPKEKAQLTFIRLLSWTMISGILIGMLLSSVAIPFWLQYDINGYAILLIILAVIAVPLFLLEYFYTRERVIEDIATEAGRENENKVPLKEQMRALFTNKFWLFTTILGLIGGIATNFKGGNVQYYYIQYLLGGTENPSMQMIYQIVTGVPLGLGAFVIYPLARKFGIKNLNIVAAVCTLTGSVLGIIFPDNIPVAMAAGFIRQVGALPSAYVGAALTCYIMDHIEFKSHVRLEGLMGVGIVGAAMSLIYAPFTGEYESLLLSMGFSDAVGVIPSAQVKTFMYICFYGFDIVLAVATLILMPFVTVEKMLPEINAELLRRKKEAVLAKGEVWLEPEEQDRLEREKEEREREENRIADLKDLCARKGLDFETENNKYLAAQAEKQKKWEAKQAAKKAKQEAKAARRKKNE